MHTAAPDRRLVTVMGHLDLHTAHHLADALQPLLDRGPHTVLLDLSGVTFLDSTGVTCLITAYRTARSTGVRLALIAPSEPVRKMLQLTGVDQVLDSYPSPEAAPISAAARVSARTGHVVVGQMGAKRRHGIDDRAAVWAVRLAMVPRSPVERSATSPVACGRPHACVCWGLTFITQQSTVKSIIRSIRVLGSMGK